MNETKQIQVDVTKLKDVECKCGNIWFDKIHVLRTVPALLAPNGQQTRVALEAFKCSECEEILPEPWMKKPDEKEVN